MTGDDGLDLAGGEARTHRLKVIPPYFDALASGDKTFEVRKNDRAYQRGDVLELREWHSANGQPCCSPTCHSSGVWAHWGPDIVLRKVVTFVYSGDPRFSGIEPGHVVLALADVDAAS